MANLDFLNNNTQTKTYNDPWDEIIQEETPFNPNGEYEDFGVDLSQIEEPTPFDEPELPFAVDAPTPYGSYASQQPQQPVQQQRPQTGPGVLSFGVPIQVQEPKETKRFITLPEGEYEFTVRSCERGYFNGSKKMSPCDKFQVELRVETEDGIADIKDTLFMLQQWSTRIYYFLVSTGVKEQGKELVLEPEDFKATVGRKGKAKISVEKFISRRDGQEKTINKVDFYLV